MGDQLLRLGHQDAGLESAARDPALDGLDERAVLRTDGVVEREVVGEPLLVDAGADEVVEEAVRPLGPARDDRADREVRPAGHHVDDRGGEQEVELPPLDLPLGVVDAAAAVPRRADLGREAGRGSPARTRRVTRRSPSSGSGARRRSGSTRGSSRRTPSSCTRTRPTRRACGTQRVDVDPALGEERRELAERIERAARARCRDSTKTNGPNVSTDTGTRPSVSRSKPGSRSARGALRSDPSSAYVQAW